MMKSINPMKLKAGPDKKQIVLIGWPNFVV